jgi:glyoxylase-like metal-dependent hydrolase (beta-lactamase superfamily II)
VLIVPFVIGPMESNAYILADEATRRAAVIDPGMESERLLDFLEAERLRLELVLNTHGHFDHVFCNGYFTSKTGARLLIHEADVPLLRELPEVARQYGFSVAEPPEPDGFLRDGDIIAVGEMAVRVYHTPGHSPGGVCLHVGEVLFSGDTLFAGSVGRTDLPGGSYEELIASIRAKLLPLPDTTLVYTGHGPRTSIGDEREYNPFLIG